MMAHHSNSSDASPSPGATDTARGVRRSMFQAIAVAVFMGGLSFAAVPLYDIFCRVTGFGGTTTTAAVGPETVSDQTIRVLFDASTHSDMPWRFRTEQSDMTVRIGETAIAFYEAHNPTNKPITGTASFNVAPLDLGSYFAKIECFCFTEQTLQPGETMRMPVTFFVDPDILQDIEHQDLKTITLSYTFFRTERTAAANSVGVAR